MEAYKIDKKWKLVYTDNLTDIKNEEKKRETQSIT